MLYRGCVRAGIDRCALAHAFRNPPLPCFGCVLCLSEGCHLAHHTPPDVSPRDDQRRIISVGFVVYRSPVVILMSDRGNLFVRSDHAGALLKLLPEVNAPSEAQNRPSARGKNWRIGGVSYLQSDTLGTCFLPASSSLSNFGKQGVIRVFSASPWTVVSSNPSGHSVLQQYSSFAFFLTPTPQTHGFRRLYIRQVRGTRYLWYTSSSQQ